MSDSRITCALRVFMAVSPILAVNDTFVLFVKYHF